VEFFNGSNKLAEISTAPYFFTWKDVPEGTYLVTAYATDNMNAKAVSASVTVIVNNIITAVNQLPIISITSPSNKKTYKKNNKIIIEAAASDPDGIITKVEFKSGSTTIAEMTAAPYSFTWEHVDTGTYTIIAIATDNLGATTNSSEVELTVDNSYDYNVEIINLYPNPNNGQFSIELNSSLPGANSNISIVNFAGNTIYNEIITGQVNSREFDLSASADGIYVLMVTHGNTLVTMKKFIKK